VDTLAAMRSFVRVVESGSFVRAAERLGLSTSAVSRQVAELEAHLSARLLQRTTRRLSLTGEGQAFYERALQLLEDLDEAESSVRAVAAEPRGRLRLTCGVTFGVRYLAPAIADFARQHPGVEFDLDLSDRVVDLIDEGFDLAIRIGPIVHAGLVGRPLGRSRLVCAAAPGYLRRRRDLPLQTPGDLERHECLAYTQVPIPNVWRFADAGGQVHEVRIAARHRANNGRLLVALATAGMGIIFEPDFIVSPEIQSGRLTRLLPQFQPIESPITAVYPSRRHLSARVRSFVDFLARRFEYAAPWAIPS
jgi:DNA-binding transcriptional LysR family regulator